MSTTTSIAPRWIVSQEGSRQDYGVPLGFQKTGGLRRLYTDIWCRWGRELLLKGPAGTRALAARYNQSIASGSVTSFTPGALRRLVAQHFRRGEMQMEELAEFYIDFGRWFATKVRRQVQRLELDPERDCFFSFNTNCLETIQHLKSRGIFCVVDQVDPGLVEEDLVVEEAARWPGWAKTPGRMTEAYWKRLRAEWEAADAVLVNSEWSRDALVRQGVPSNHIIIAPCTINLQRWGTDRPINPNGSLKVVWLGSLILRKGIQYLAEAARLVLNEEIEFLIAGPVGISEQAVKAFPPNMRMLGRITRDRSAAVYRAGHVFVLPTLSDGFAVTQLEAMAQGLPVVATPNCARVVTDGENGFVVPPRDSAALAAALQKLNQDRKLLLEMSCNSLRTVRNYESPADAILINQHVQDFRAKRRQGSLPERSGLHPIVEAVTCGQN